LQKISIFEGKIETDETHKKPNPSRHIQDYEIECDLKEKSDITKHTAETANFGLH
jgi:hypothetical protein